MARGKNEVTLTFAGDSDQLEHAFGKVGEASRNMSDEVGKASKRTSEEVKGVGASLNKFGEAADVADTRAMGFRDSLTGVQDTMAGTAAIASGDLFDGFLLLGMGIGDLGSGIFNFLVPSLKSMIERMGAAKLAMAGFGIAAAGAALFGLALLSRQSKVTGNDISKVREDLERLARTAETTTVLKKFFNEGGDSLHDFQGELEIASDGFKSFTQDVNTLGGTIGDRAVDKFNELDAAMAQIVDDTGDADEAFAALVRRTDGSAASIEMLRAVLPQYAEAQARANERTGESEQAQTDASLAVRAHINNLKDLADTLKAQTDPVFAFVTAQKGMRDAQNNVNETAKEFGRGSQQYRDAILDLAKAQLDLVDATADVQGATDASLIPALKRLQTDGHLSKESLDAVTNAINGAKNAADRLDGTRMRLRLDLLTRGSIPFGGRFQEFHSGGIVPGAPGTETLALLQAGERVQTQAQQQSQGRGLGADDLRMMSGSGLDRVFLQWLEGLLRANNLQLVRS